MDGRVAALRISAVLTVAKLAGWLSRNLRRGSGNAVPGAVADFLFPGLIGVLAQQLTEGIVIVTGTNGKTTTTKLVGDMLASSGRKVVTNRSGSNMKQGIVSALVADAGMRGRLRGSPTIGLFEVDEATVPLIMQVTGASHVLVTNLFRDQLDRYGEVDTLVDTLGNALDGTDARIYLNADDPMVASLSHAVGKDQVTYFGLEIPATAAVDSLQTAVDSTHCPRCGERLRFERRFYSHLGHYACPRNDYVRPHPAVFVSSVKRAGPDGCSFTVHSAGGHHQADLPLGGLYNVYNAVAALALADGLGVSTATALRSLEAATAAFGRVEDIVVDGRLLRLVLVKNPAGFTQVLDTFVRGATDSNVLIAVNDSDADGRDVSWLWDVPFQFMANAGHHVVVAGARAAEMAVRLHYADIDSVSVIPALADAVQEILRQTTPGDGAYFFATYTAMLSLRESLSLLTPISSIGTERV